MKRIKPFLTTGVLCLFLCGISGLQAADYKTKKSYKEWPREASKFAEAFYRTDEARRIGENVLLYQLESGGWPKNIYIPEELTPDERKKAETGKADVRRGTIDNRATTTEIDYCLPCGCQNCPASQGDEPRRGGGGLTPTCSPGRIHG